MLARRIPLDRFRPFHSICIFSMFLMGISLASSASATWSVVAVDTETLEVAVGSATCVPNIDLFEETPAVAVGKGAGAAQSLVDSSGVRRQIMFDGFQAGTPADDIMALMIALSGSNIHQNGLATNLGDAATFSGSSTFGHSSGQIGSTGSIHYAIQGNVLTGRPVIDMAEAALVGTVGDLPAKFMAAMEAARAMGGDGRCSCPATITGCGAPPASFTKSADVGYMILARYGDTDDSNCNAGGCADGDYFMTFNVANQASSDPDPVEQLQSQFDTWRGDLESRPDAIASTVTFIPSGGDMILRLAVNDWRELAVTMPVSSVVVGHHPDSGGSAVIGTPVDQGGGIYETTLTGGSEGDVFLITIDDGIRPVVIPPTRTRFPGVVLFTDGFESGDVSAWDLSVSG